MDPKHAPVRLDAASPATPPTLWARARRSPLVLLLLFLVVLVPMRIGIAFVESLTVADHQGFTLSVPLNLLWTALFVAIYMLLVRVLERRPASELRGPQWLPELATGIAIGGLLMTMLVGLLYAAGAYTVAAIRMPPELIGAVSLWLFVAVAEEIGLRAVIFRLVEAWAGSWAAIVISSVAFGLIHTGNPNASWAGAVGIALQSGLLYALVFMITRRLWAVIGIHFSWNLVEGSVFGLPVSGYDFPGIFISGLEGPAWLTGGAFGPEASLPALLLCLAASGAALAIAWRRRCFLQPSWRRTSAGRRSVPGEP